MVESSLSLRALAVSLSLMGVAMLSAGESSTLADPMAETMPHVAATIMSQGNETVAFTHFEYALDASNLADRIASAGRLEVPYEGGLLTLIVSEEAVTFADGTNAYITFSPEGNRVVNQFTARFFRGHVEGDDSSRATLLADVTGLYGMVAGASDSWSLQPVRIPANQEWPEGKPPLWAGHIYQDVWHKNGLSTRQSSYVPTSGTDAASAPALASLPADVTLLLHSMDQTSAAQAVDSPIGIPSDEPCRGCLEPETQDCLPECIPPDCLECLVPDIQCPPDCPEPAIDCPPLCIDPEDCPPQCIDPEGCPPQCIDPPCLNCIDPFPCEEYAPAGDMPDPHEAFCLLPPIPCPAEDTCIYWPGDPCTNTQPSICVGSGGGFGAASPLLLQIKPYAEHNYVLYASDWYNRIVSAYYAAQTMWADETSIQLGWFAPEDTNHDMQYSMTCSSSFDSGLKDFISWVQPYLDTDRNAYQLFSATWDPQSTTLGCGSLAKLSNHENTNEDRVKAMSAVTAKHWSSYDLWTGGAVYDPDVTHDLAIVAMHELTHNAGAYVHYQDRKNWCNYNVEATGVPVGCQEMWRATGAIFDVRNYSSTVLCDPC